MLITQVFHGAHGSRLARPAGAALAIVSTLLPVTVLEVALPVLASFFLRALSAATETPVRSAFLSTTVWNTGLTPPTAVLAQPSTVGTPGPDTTLGRNGTYALFAGTADAPWCGGFFATPGIDAKTVETFDLFVNRTASAIPTTAVTPTFLSGTIRLATQFVVADGCSVADSAATAAAIVSALFSQTIEVAIEEAFHWILSGRIRHPFRVATVHIEEGIPPAQRLIVAILDRQLFASTSVRIPFVAAAMGRNSRTAEKTLTRDAQPFLADSAASATAVIPADLSGTRRLTVSISGHRKYSKQQYPDNDGSHGSTPRQGISST